MSIHYLTRSKLNELQDELSELVNIKRPIVLEELKQARSLGDLSENSDYDVAKEKQEHLEKRIQELKTILQHFEIIENPPLEKNATSKIVKIGSKVRVHNSLTNREYVYEILGSLDADPSQMKISNESPIAKTILGKPVGGTYSVEGLKKTYQITILEVF